MCLIRTALNENQEMQMCNETSLKIAKPIAVKISADPGSHVKEFFETSIWMISSTYLCSIQKVSFYTICLPLCIIIGTAVILAIIMFWMLYRVSSISIVGRHLIYSYWHLGTI